MTTRNAMRWKSVLAAFTLYVLAAAVSVIGGSAAGWWFLAGCGCALVVALAV